MRTLGDTSKRPHVTHLLLSTTTSQTSKNFRGGKAASSSSEQRTKESSKVFTERASDERVSSSLIVVFYGKILETTYLGFSCVEFRVSYLDFLRRPFSLFFSLFRLIDSFVSTHKISFSLVKRLVFCASQVVCLGRETRVKRRRRRYTRERIKRFALCLSLFVVFLLSHHIESLPP